MWVRTPAQGAEEGVFQYAWVPDTDSGSPSAFFDHFEAIIRLILAALIESMLCRVLAVRLDMCRVFCRRRGLRSNSGPERGKVYVEVQSLMGKRGEVYTVCKVLFKRGNSFPDR